MLPMGQLPSSNVSGDLPMTQQVYLHMGELNYSSIVKSLIESDTTMREILENTPFTTLGQISQHTPRT